MITVSTSNMLRLKPSSGSCPESSPMRRAVGQGPAGSAIAVFSAGASSGSVLRQAPRSSAKTSMNAARKRFQDFDLINSAPFLKNGRMSGFDCKNEAECVLRVMLFSGLSVRRHRRHARGRRSRSTWRSRSGRSRRNRTCRACTSGVRWPRRAGRWSGISGS